MKKFVILSLIICSFLLYKKPAIKQIASPTLPNISQPTPIPIIPPSPDPKIITYEPVWTDYPPIRSPEPNHGKILGDIESHLPAGNIYIDSDLITSGHEQSHGIASELRKKYNTNAKINCFYCLENKAVLINSPDKNITIQKVASGVPSSLRGGVYNLYLVQQAPAWGDVPLYIFDEFVAYTNGSAVRKDLQINERSETVTYMMEFNIYSLVLAQTIKKDDPNYNDTQFKNFLGWNIERTMKIYNQEQGAKDYLAKFQTNPDAEELREFTRNYLGKDWAKKILDI